jgi:plastocyanin
MTWARVCWVSQHNASLGANIPRCNGADTPIAAALVKTVTVRASDPGGSPASIGIVGPMFSSAKLGKLFVSLVAVATVALSACGDDDTTALDENDVDLLVVAFDSNDFDEDAYTVEPGEVTIGYEHGGNIPHTLVIEGIDTDEFKLEVNTSGDTDVGTVELEPGEYILFCDVPGHRAAGMEATLTVE